MKNMHDNEHYQKYEGFKPLAVRQYKDDLDQTRYIWNEDKETTEHYADSAVWLPALGNDHTHISLGSSYLMTKAQAEHEARLIATRLAKALK